MRCVYSDLFAALGVTSPALCDGFGPYCRGIGANCTDEAGVFGRGVVSSHGRGKSWEVEVVPCLN